MTSWIGTHTSIGANWGAMGNVSIRHTEGNIKQGGCMGHRNWSGESTKK